MSWYQRIALLLSLCGVLLSAWVTEHTFEAVPHLEDEVAYAWQARLMADLRLSIPSPEFSEQFLVPFVVDYQGLRFGKYPPGWPAALALGILLGLRAWVNPLLAGFGVWLTFRLGERVFSPLVGLLAAGLTLTSPFFLMNSGSLLSHPLGLVCTAGFALGWLEAFSLPEDSPQRGWVLLSALSLGVLCLSRPFTALAAALPFGVHGVYLLWRGSRAVRLRLLGFSGLVLLMASMVFAWQAQVTGDPLLNPYTLWWPYDKLGFGPGHGVLENGHTLRIAWQNAEQSLEVGWLDLFGWYRFSWLFLPFGVLAAWQSRRRIEAALVGSVFVSLVLCYLAYWVGATLFGPRYYYEGLFSLTLFSAAGVSWLAGWPRRFSGWAKLRPLLVTGLLTGLVVFNLMAYLPLRLNMMHHLFGISRQDQAFFLQPEVQALAPALVVVQAERWMDYATLLELSDPYLTSPFIFAWTTSPATAQRLGELYPARRLLIYDPELPDRFRNLILPSPPE